MKTTAEQINSKLELTEAAITLYSTYGSFTISQLIEATGYNASQIYALFPNKKSILEFYYPALVLRYTAMIEEINDFEESYTIGEKLSSFIFSSFDMMSEKKSFVENTFQSMVFHKGKNSAFHQEVTTLFKHFFTTDGNIAVSAAFFMNNVFYSFITTQYLFLVKFWLDDDSEGKERSVALTDKYTAFIQEVCYTKVVDKGFDLVKYFLGSAKITEGMSGCSGWISDFFDDADESVENAEVEIEVEAAEDDE